MNKVFFGDCRDSMRKMIDCGVKVQTCVTSPPYFGLRDYGHPGQLGLESTPQEYVKNMVEVFRLVWELLSEDGTLWLNIGDSYAGGGNYRGIHSESSLSEKQRSNGGARGVSQLLGAKKLPGIKSKDLIGVPWMLAFALRNDGWYLRQEIIWHKRNPMPESVTDRCTKSHEQIFLLSKSPRYYFDHEAIKEDAIGGTPGSVTHKGKTAYEAGDERMRTKAGLTNIGAIEKRNKRSVWEVATQPYSGAHFATFPPALIEPCILAGSRPGDIVLDPFFGSGTTGQVSQALGRQWIGCELNEGYAELQNDRTAQLGMALA